MGQETGIAWTRSTRNLWTGCTKIGPGCNGCYAEAFQRFVRGKDAESGEAKNWGPGRPRIPHLEGAFKDLRKWNRAAGREYAEGIAWDCGPYTTKWPSLWPSLMRGPFWPVFLNTQSDFFDNEAPQEWRDRSYEVIEECTNLTFYLVTKRVGNVAKMVHERWMRDGFPAHVRLLITVVNQEEADRDIPKLLALPCKNGLSIEPMLGPITFRPYTLLYEHCFVCDIEDALNQQRGSQSHPINCAWRKRNGGKSELNFGATARGIEWVIVGGESAQGGHPARPFNIEWARSTIRQCKAACVPVFVKQIGSKPVQQRVSKPWPAWAILEDDGNGLLTPRLRDRAGADPAEWLTDLCVRQWPEER